MPEPIHSLLASRVGHFVTASAFATHSRARILVLTACTVAEVCWNRFNTGRSFAFIVWVAVATWFLLPVSPSPLEASHDGVRSSATVQTTVQNPTSRYQAPVTISGCTPFACMSLHHSPEIMAYQRQNLDECWGPSAMHVTEAQSIAGPLREVVVAVLDTGIDAVGPLLGECLYQRVSVVDSGESADSLGHGTHVAGTIAAIAPNSRIVDIRVADSRGSCTSTDVAKGILKAIAAGADVINLSLEVEGSPELQAAIECAWQRGAVLVAAAGMPLPEPGCVRNSQSEEALLTQPNLPLLSSPVCPASYPQVIAVTGTNENDELAPLCNRGDWVDLAAPGLRTYSDLPGGTRGYLTGTSTATSHVSGVAALLLGIVRDENGDGRVNDEVRNALEMTARPIDIEGTGSGIVDAVAAVTFMQS